MNSSAPLTATEPGSSTATAPAPATPSGSTPCTVQPIDSESSFDAHITKLPASCLAVIYFHAPWAEPCKQMSTILSTLASTYTSSDVEQRIAFYSLDAEEVSDVSERYDVTQVPLVVLQRGGQVVESITGTDASKVRNAVEKHAGSPTSGDPGRAGLPPAQSVTKPAPKASEGTDGSAGTAKYAPRSSDPTTAPQQTSSEADPAKAKEDLDTRLSELVKAAPVMLFMKGTPSAPQCGFSRQTVSILREKGVRYGFFNILADDEVRQGLKEYSEWPTFPQVYVGGELVGGLVSQVVVVRWDGRGGADLFAGHFEGGVRERPRLPQRLLCAFAEQDWGTCGASDAGADGVDNDYLIARSTSCITPRRLVSTSSYCSLQSSRL